MKQILYIFLVALIRTFVPDKMPSCRCGKGQFPTSNRRMKSK
jgi:hypothetical protein